MKHKKSVLKILSANSECFRMSADIAPNIDIGAIKLKTNNMTTETKPNDVITGFNGLTKREYFAGLAMQAMVGECGDEKYIAGQACSIADALIEELNESK